MAVGGSWRFHEDVKHILRPSESVDEITLDEFSLRKYHIASTPYGMFRAEAREEVARMLSDLYSGSRLSPNTALPFEAGFPLSHRAANRVRSRWIKQGIWKEEWGPPWGTNSSNIEHPRGPRIHVYSTWGHEKDLEPDERYEDLQKACRGNEKKHGSYFGRQPMMCQSPRSVSGGAVEDNIGQDENEVEIDEQAEFRALWREDVPSMFVSNYSSWWQEDWKAEYGNPILCLLELICRQA
jgi:hypothetical protein